VEVLTFQHRQPAVSRDLTSALWEQSGRSVKLIIPSI